jgi:hypothetical protein
LTMSAWCFSSSADCVSLPTSIRYRANS